MDRFLFGTFHEIVKKYLVSQKAVKTRKYIQIYMFFLYVLVQLLYYLGLEKYADVRWRGKDFGHMRIRGGVRNWQKYSDVFNVWPLSALRSKTCGPYF